MKILYSIYLTFFPIYIFASMLTLLHVFYTMFKIRRMSNLMLSHEMSDILNSKLFKFTRKFETKNIFVNIYIQLSCIYAGLTFIVFSDNFWLSVFCLFLWSVARVSIKILNVITVGVYFKDILQSVGQILFWLPYFIIRHIHGFNIYKVNGFIEYLNSIGYFTIKP